MTESMFDKSGGYYAVYLDDVLMATFAPSTFWSEFANSMADVQGFRYEWIQTEESPTRRFYTFYHSQEDRYVEFGPYESHIEAKEAFQRRYGYWPKDAVKSVPYSR